MAQFRTQHQADLDRRFDELVEQAEELACLFPGVRVDTTDVDCRADGCQAGFRIEGVVASDGDLLTGLISELANLLALAEATQRLRILQRRKEDGI